MNSKQEDLKRSTQGEEKKKICRAM